MTDFVAQDKVELGAGEVAVVVSIGFASCAAGVSVDSMTFDGGELVFGRLVTESVGELVVGVAIGAVECVCASLARLFV